MDLFDPHRGISGLGSSPDGLNEQAIWRDGGFHRHFYDHQFEVSDGLRCGAVIHSGALGLVGVEVNQFVPNSVQDSQSFVGIHGFRLAFCRMNALSPMRKLWALRQAALIGGYVMASDGFLDSVDEFVSGDEDLAQPPFTGQ